MVVKKASIPLGYWLCRFFVRYLKSLTGKRKAGFSPALPTVFVEIPHCGKLMTT
jgi:hypothetical protein